MTQTSALAAKARPPLMADMLTGLQIRAARAMLRWSASDLAEHSGVSLPAIQRAEKVDEMPNMQSRNLAAIKAALEGAGCVFLDAGEQKLGGAGVRLR